ncbi:MAG: nuclear transport factor 2 family protein [Steroidobacteraceae bacterium]
MRYLYRAFNALALSCSLVIAGTALAASKDVDLKALQAKVERQQDYIDIQNLMSTRTYYHSVGLQEKEFDELFARHQPDLSIGTNGGYRVGWDNARKGYVERSAKLRAERLRQLHAANDSIQEIPENLGIGTFQNHSLASPLIQVAEDGKTAKGMWYSGTVKVSTNTSGKFESQLAWEKFAVDFIREDGQWRIWHLLILSDFSINTGDKPMPSTPSSVPAVPNDISTTVARSWAPNVVPQLNPLPPKPYRTFSETFSYGPPAKAAK